MAPRKKNKNQNGRNQSTGASKQLSQVKSTSDVIAAPTSSTSGTKSQSDAPSSSSTNSSTNGVTDVNQVAASMAELTLGAELAADRYMARAMEDEVERQLETALVDLKLRRLMIPKDGACLFRCVADHVYGTQALHERVRAECADYLEAHAAEYAPFVDEDSFDVQASLTLEEKRAADTDANPSDGTEDAEQRRFRHYVQQVRHVSFWGGELELSVITCLYKLCVCIYSLNAEKCLAVSNRIGEEFAEADTNKRRDSTLRLCFSHGNHYDILMPINRWQRRHYCQSLLYDMLSVVDGMAPADALGAELHPYRNCGLVTWLRNEELQARRDEQLAREFGDQYEAGSAERPFREVRNARNKRRNNRSAAFNTAFGSAADSTTASASDSKKKVANVQQTVPLAMDFPTLDGQFTLNESADDVANADETTTSAPISYKSLLIKELVIVGAHTIDPRLVEMPPMCTAAPRALAPASDAVGVGLFVFGDDEHMGGVQRSHGQAAQSHGRQEAEEIGAADDVAYRRGGAYQQQQLLPTDASQHRFVTGNAAYASHHQQQHQHQHHHQQAAIQQQQQRHSFQPLDDSYRHATYVHAQQQQQQQQHAHQHQSGAYIAYQAPYTTPLLALSDAYPPYAYANAPMPYMHGAHATHSSAALPMSMPMGPNLHGQVANTGAAPYYYYTGEVAPGAFVQMPTYMGQ